VGLIGLTLGVFIAFYLVTRVPDPEFPVGVAMLVVRSLSATFKAEWFVAIPVNIFARQHF